MISRKCIAVALLAACASPAAAFDFSFDWGNIPLCNDARAHSVPSPVFTFKDVPEGTKFIDLRMVDLDYKPADHGGGLISWPGGTSGKIPAGAFKYNSPCPPKGNHTYEWTATARTKKMGGKIGTAKARRSYPK